MKTLLFLLYSISAFGSDIAYYKPTTTYGYFLNVGEPFVNSVGLRYQDISVDLSTNNAQKLGIGFTGYINFYKNFDFTPSLGIDYNEIANSGDKPLFFSVGANCRIPDFATIGLRYSTLNKLSVTIGYTFTK